MSDQTASLGPNDVLLRAEALRKNLERRVPR